jgi:Helix-turn-helix domain
MAKPDRAPEDFRYRTNPRKPRQTAASDQAVEVSAAHDDAGKDLDFLNPKPIQSKKADVLKILQISSATFDRLIARGELRAHKIGVCWFVTHIELKRFLKSRTRGADAIAHRTAEQV